MASARELGTCLMPACSSGGSSYRSLSTGSGGSMWFRMPSRPAISCAEKARNGLQDGSGARNSMRFAAGEVPGQRDTDGGGAVACGVHQVDRSFEARDQTVVGVQGRVGEGQHGGGVLDQAADVPAGKVGQTTVVLLIVEQRLAVPSTGTGGNACRCRCRLRSASA